ncbi:MAG: hypothetical protein HFF07_04035 [Oscillospiraceae bacterium]|nr:hypothetical protein [Oscillospiraceae bacterium]
MEGKNGGKRLVTEPKKGPGGGRIAAIAAAALAAVLLVGYAGLCAYAGGRIYPNTTAFGLDISGMDREEARRAVQSQAAALTQGRRVELREPSSGAAVSLELEGLVSQLELELWPGEYDRGRAVTGIKYLSHLFSGETADISGDMAFTPEGQERLEEALEELSRKAGVAGNETTYRITEEELIFTKGRTGRTLDVQEASSQLRQAVFHGLSQVEVPVVEAPPAEPDMEAIREELYAEVSDAYLDRETEEIVPSVTGRDLDLEAARIALSQTADGKVCRVPLQLTQPKMTTEQLSESLFRDVLGEATTRVTGTAIRRENVSVAAAHVNGTILFPGEEFSFNQTCSPYAVSNGYGKATAYVNGLSKDTVAGGVCQASSTLYWAVLKANLEVLDRRPHRYEPSYVKGGLDATVFGNYGDEGSTDFRFKNNTEEPLRITAEMDGKNYLKVTISGTDTTGIHGEPYSTNRVVTQAYQTIYEASANVPQGTTQKDPERTGYNGVTIDTYQKLVDKEGNTVSETKLYSTRYYHRNETILFNPADLALWNIDPVTGIRTDPPPAVETPAGGEETPIPQETSPQLPPEETGIAPPPEAGEPTLPPVSQEPSLPQLTPPPAELPSATPEPSPAETQTILPPGTILGG